MACSCIQDRKHCDVCRNWWCYGNGWVQDLMFSHPDDPPSVTEVRKFQLANIAKWIADFPQDAAAKSWGDEL